MEGTYKCKPRFQNPETFVEVKKVTKGFSVTHYFKSGVTQKEEWSVKDFKDNKPNLTKVKEIKWKKKEEGEEKCQTQKKAPVKKKALVKKNPVKKSISKKSVIKK